MAASRLACAAAQERGAFVHGVLNLGFEFLYLEIRGHAAHVDIAVIEVVLAFRGRADAVDVFPQLRHEVVVERLFDVYPLDGYAGLSAVGEAAPECPVHRAVQVGVGEDDHGVLSAQFEFNGDQVARGLFHDRLSGGFAAGEEDLVRVVVDAAGADFLGAVDNVDDVLHEAALFDDFLHQAL